MRASLLSVPFLASIPAFVVATALTSVTGCGGSTVDIGGFDGGSVSGSSGNEGGLSPGSDGSVAPSGPAYEVHLRATQAKVNFTDGYAGETPLDQHIAIRKLTLLRQAGDPAPVVVFDNGQNAVECGLNDGNDTLVGTAVAKTLPAGTFTIAQVEVGYYRFKVAATMHSNGMNVPGDYSDLEVLTDATMVDGKLQNQGHYSFTFEVGGTAYGTLTGEDLVTPVDLAGGGLSLVTANHSASYVFPVNVVIDPNLASTVKAVMIVNTYQNFRWQDQAMSGYQTGVFDTTPTTYEPVMSFGANSFTLGIE